MPDVFISYSRKDATVAVLIADQIQVSGFECWLDQENIPSAEDWRDELELGIRQSDNFLFLISPDSLDSNECTKERLAAVAFKKRIIPVVVHPLRKDQTIGDDLSKPQQINAMSGLSDIVFAQISSAIMRDLPWKRQSTEYLNLAKKWEEGKGGLLRPTELEPARNWRKQGIRISPGPTDLQLCFIDESERTYMASRFVANADRFIEREPDRALLLAAEACSLVDAPWTKRVLATTLDRHRSLYLYLHEFCDDPATDISDLGFSRDGSNLAATGVFDVLSPEPVETGLRCWTFPNVSLRRQILVEKGLGCLAWGRTSNDIAVGKGSTVAVMGIGKGKLTGTKLDKHSQSLRRLAIDPTASFLVSGDEEGTMIIWKLENGESVRQFDGLGQVRSLAWSGDGSWLIAAGRDRALLLTSPEFSNPREFRFDDWIQAADISADGMFVAFLAMHNRRDQCFIYNCSEDQWRGWRVPQHKGILSDVRFSRDGRYVFTSGGGGSLGAAGIVQWDIAEGEAIRTLFGGFEYRISRLAISSDNRMLVAGGSERKVILFDLKVDHALPMSVQRWDSPATAIATDPSGGETTGLANGQILLSGCATGDGLHQLGSGNGVEVIFLRYNQTGDRLVSVNKENMITLWDLHSGTRLVQVSAGHDGPITGLAFSKTGRFIATCGNDGTIFLLSGDNLEIIYRIAPEDPWSQMPGGNRWPVSSITFDPEERTLVSGSLNSMLRFWDVPTGQLIRPLLFGGIGSTDALSIQDIAFNTDGKRLLWSCGFHTYLLPIDQLDHLPFSTIFENTQIINPQQVRLQQHLDTIIAVAFSPDSHSYASVGGDKLLLCDSEEDEPIGLLTCLDNFRTLSYSADGKSLRCLANDGTVLRMEISTAQWIEHTRRKANRTLTEEERTQFGQ
jgi:WD40 repeat protein